MFERIHSHAVEVESDQGQDFDAFKEELKTALGNGTIIEFYQKHWDIDREQAMWLLERHVLLATSVNRNVSKDQRKQAAEELKAKHPDLYDYMTHRYDPNTIRRIEVAPEEAFGLEHGFTS